MQPQHAAGGTVFRPREQAGEDGKQWEFWVGLLGTLLDSSAAEVCFSHTEGGIVHVCCMGICLARMSAFWM
jgi:hypothetical protein